MRNYRFTISKLDKLELEANSLTIRNSELLHQLHNVIRLKPGHKEEISFIDGTGIVFDTQLQELSKDFALFEIMAMHESSRELNQDYCFYIPIIKPEAFALMLRKLVELGVQKFVPVIFERSQKKYIEVIIKQRSRFEKIIQEATEQCEGAVFAELVDPIDFQQIEADADMNIFANERLAESSLRGARSATWQSSQGSIALLVGPEGGLTDTEVKSLKTKGFHGISLGPRILKAETAAISLIIHCLITLDR